VQEQVNLQKEEDLEQEVLHNLDLEIEAKIEEEEVVSEE
jgi:hypothetical protein